LTLSVDEQSNSSACLVQSNSSACFGTEWQQCVFRYSLGTGFIWDF